MRYVARLCDVVLITTLDSTLHVSSDRHHVAIIASIRAPFMWVIKTFTGVTMRFGESRVILAQCDSNDARSDCNNI